MPVPVEKPSICSESALQFSSLYSLPTATLLIQIKSSGDGSICNITTSGGIELKNLKCPARAAPVPASMVTNERTA